MVRDNRMKRNNRIIATLALLLASWSAVQGAITIVGPVIHTPYTICPDFDGGNQLAPDPPEHIDPPQAGQGVLAELANTNNLNFSGWTFNAGSALNGTLTINVYQSHFSGTHKSGAIIRCTYAPATNDPATLRWIQLADSTAPGKKSESVRYTSPWIDTWNDKAASPAPFYWTTNQHEKHNGVFEDFSQREHPPTSAVVWRGYLYLTSWNGKTPGTVTLHDGIKWGFDAGCAAAGVTNVSLVSTTATHRIIFTWPTNSPGTNLPGWRLESTTNLAPGTAWQPRTNGVEQTNGNYRVSLPITESQEFFRLSMDITGGIPDLQPAHIRVQPLSDNVSQGHESYLSVGAGGSLPIHFQWFQNGVPIPDATNTDLDFPHVQFTNQGAYFVIVTNSVDGEQSATVQIQVTFDTTPPQLISASASSNLTQIIVNFSEPVTPGTAQNPGSYQVQGEIGPPIQIINATMGSDESIVTLTPSPGTPLMPHIQYLLQAGGISDFATPPNFIQPGPGSSTTFTTGP